MNSRSQRRERIGFILGLLLAIATPILVIAINSLDTGFNVGSTATTINAHGVCQTARATDGNSYFIPTKTSGEWASVRTNKPAGLTLGTCSTPGSQTYSTPGSYTFTIPAYTTLTVQVWGAGGGGGSTYDRADTSKNGAAGGYSSFAGALVAYGGGGGSKCTIGTGGGGGTASGGTTNTSGASGGNGTFYYPIAGQPSWPVGGAGGSSPGGGAGGAGAKVLYAPGSGSDPLETLYSTEGHPGSAPGGGGGGGGGTNGTPCNGGGGGGGGAYSAKTYTAGQLAVGASVTIVVGSDGAGGLWNGPGARGFNGGNGAAGRVYISWQ